MAILIHNTRRENAERILEQRRINANVEMGRCYGVNSGPFFFLAGQEGSEVPSGGERHEIDLFFECTLPSTEPLSRAEINRALATGHYENLRGHVVLGTGIRPGVVEQAIIIPDERACLTLIRVEPSIKPGLWSRILRRPEDLRPFDVLLPTTA
ncbi:MAG: hypothetical protein J7498_02035 [Sphingobium sp.]|nr:hypothetical protein [Sphingobium sp.]